MESYKKNDNIISVNFTEDESLVLFEWLIRFNSLEEPGFEDQAEQRVLWDLEAVFEKQITDAFKHDYEKRLLQARKKIRD